MRAYDLMCKNILNFKNGRRTFTVERLATMCDVFYANGRLTDEELSDLTNQIKDLKDAASTTA